MKEYRTIYVIGPSGCGKTTIGSQLAEKLHREFIEGDDIHSNECKSKMKEGTPLTDEDRMPWLTRIRDIARKEGKRVLACSALKKTYREFLSENTTDTLFVYLKADKEELQKRLMSRKGHYFPPQLLASQLAALEAPAQTNSHYLVVDTSNLSPEDTINYIIEKIDAPNNS